MYKYGGLMVLILETFCLDESINWDKEHSLLNQSLN